MTDLHYEFTLRVKIESLILTLTVNPAIDRNILVDRLVFEDRAYILSRNESAGGRGINASRVLHSFGAKTRGGGYIRRNEWTSLREVVGASPDFR